jgi:radical SAM protein with 4Fe4S-binding SPASM domain
MGKADAQITGDIPAKVYLDVTPDCNLFCTMCRESPANSGRVMGLGLFKRIVDETCEGVTSYSLFNFGESLLLPDFKERLAYVSQRKLPNATIDLSTNGMLLTEDTSKFLIDSDVEVSISFDGSSAERFEGIRRGSGFGEVCRNTERIAAIASHMNPFLAPGIAISIQQENWRDLVSIVTVANDLGVKRVSMWPVVNPRQFRIAPDERVVKEIASAILYAEDKGMAVDLYPVKLGDYVWAGNGYTGIQGSFVDKKCNAPFICTGVAWDGEVYLCCNYGDTVENMEGKSFQDVWNGRRYRELRRRVNDESNLPRSCMDCFWVNRY